MFAYYFTKIKKRNTSSNKGQNPKKHLKLMKFTAIPVPYIHRGQNGYRYIAICENYLNLMVGLCQARQSSKIPEL
jgi:hypothetical protein